MSDLLNQIGMRIWERRKQMRFTQEELAEKAGVTSQTISNAEHGTKALRPENIVKICTALEISTDYLLLGSIADGMPSPEAGPEAGERGETPEEVAAQASLPL